MPKKEFYVSPSAELVFVSDFFRDDLVGGAELTHDAILKKCPYKFDKIHSLSVTPEMVEENKDKRWLLGNISQINRDALVTIARETKYSIIECDYLYCVFRSSHLHKIQTGNECDCHLTDSGRFVKGLFKRAESVHFMSEGQKQEYLRLFPLMKKWPKEKLLVQGSTFSDETLMKLQALYRGREAGIRPKAGKWAIMGNGTWIKNKEATEKYCVENKIPYEVIGKHAPDKFLQELSGYDGLVFHPRGFDTAPRLTMEAKVMGLDLDLNSNVQHSKESWFSGSREECLDSLKGRAENFWRNFKQ